jgi:hypothetical protein
VSPHFLDFYSRSLPLHFTITRPLTSHNLCGLEHQFFVHALLSLSYHVTLSASLCASACGSISKRLLASWIDRDISYYYNAQGYSKRYSLLESLYATPSAAEPPRSFPTNYNKNYFRFTNDTTSKIIYAILRRHDMNIGTQKGCIDESSISKTCGTTITVRAPNLIMTL